MSEQIKYEAVFGDQSLFDGAIGYAPDESIFAVKYLMSSGSIIKTPSIKFIAGVQQAIEFVANQTDITSIAQRRIIRAPTWTMEDQKAGNLPEAGCSVSFCHKLNTNWRTGEIKYIDDQVIVIKADNTDRPFVYEVERVEFKPIESPEEKAARLRSEWINKAYVDFHRLGCELEVLQKEQIKVIYDALLSGDLPVPGKGE